MNKALKIHILFEFVDGPWGGANQFLKALREAFKVKNCYTESKEEANIILFNSNPSPNYQKKVRECLALKKKFPEKYVFNRIDGPILTIRNQDFHYDQVFFNFDKILADGTIFQSSCSKTKCLNLNMPLNKNNITITNAANAAFFSPKKDHLNTPSNKLKIIATSWSANPKKGFKIYDWLDKHLNFEQFQMTFIGNSPIKFKNIKYIPPLSSKEIGEELRKHDLYITASQKDPCSNSLIEALSSGLPCVALNDGGHPEIIGKGGEVFTSKEELIPLFKKIKANYTDYQANIGDFSFETACNRYLNFFQDAINASNSKTITYKDELFLSKQLLKVSFQEKFYKRVKKYIPWTK